MRRATPPSQAKLGFGVSHQLLDLSRAAEAAGLSFRHGPIVSGQPIRSEDAEAMAAALDEAKKLRLGSVAHLVYEDGDQSVTQPVPGVILEVVLEGIGVFCGGDRQGRQCTHACTRQSDSPA